METVSAWKVSACVRKAGPGKVAPKWMRPFKDVYPIVPDEACSTSRKAFVNVNKDSRGRIAHNGSANWTAIAAAVWTTIVFVRRIITGRDAS